MSAGVSTGVSTGIAITGIASLPLERIVVGIRSNIDKGKLVCNKGKYAYHSGYKYTDVEYQFEQGKKAWLENSKQNLAGYSKNTYGAASAATELWLNLFSPSKEGMVYLTESVLFSVFPPHKETYGGGSSMSKPPPCNEENLKLVKVYLDKTLKETNDAFVASLLPTGWPRKIYAPGAGKSQK